MTTMTPGPIATKTATVTVTNVVPSLAITGPTSVAENASNSWTLGTVVEPGTDTVTSYVVNWGDGSTDNFTAAEIATANRVISHMYSDGPNNYTISVDLIDEDGTHAAAGTLNVAVNNVVPTLAISGAATANEGDALHADSFLDRLSRQIRLANGRSIGATARRRGCER